MSSLRTRLLVTLATVLLLAWGLGFTIQYLDLLERQDKEIDDMLRGIAEKMLQSLPVDIDTVGRERKFMLSGESPVIPGKLDALCFQVWEHKSRRLLMSSQPVLDQALVPTFLSGATDVFIDNTKWRVFAINDSDKLIQVQIGLPRSAIRAGMVRWMGPTLLAALLLLAGIGLAIWLVIHWSLRPVFKVSESIVMRDPLDLSLLPESALPQEFTPLVHSFNQLMGRLAVALQREREFLGEAAHELRTPLAALLSQAQVLQFATANTEESKIALENLITGVERASRLAQQLLDTARIEASVVRTQCVDLGFVVAMVADEFSLLAQRDGKKVEVERGYAPVRGNIDELGILVRNLLDNSLRHGGSDTHVKLKTEVGADNKPILVIEDNGPGIPASELQLVFKRFYRAESRFYSHGAGLGLSLVERVVASHRGEINCGTGLEGRGFRVEVRFPNCETPNSDVME